jgi:hypothetical protein
MSLLAGVTIVTYPESRRGLAVVPPLLAAVRVVLLVMAA